MDYGKIFSLLGGHGSFSFFAHYGRYFPALCSNQLCANVLEKAQIQAIFLVPPARIGRKKPIKGYTLQFWGDLGITFVIRTLVPQFS